jgi:hypothetical protein
MSGKLRLRWVIYGYLLFFAGMASERAVRAVQPRPWLDAITPDGWPTALLEASIAIVLLIIGWRMIPAEEKPHG